MEMFFAQCNKYESHNKDVTAYILFAALLSETL